MIYTPEALVKQIEEKTEPTQVERDFIFSMAAKRIAKTKLRKKQVDLDRAYRARQREQGIVRKTVRVPANRWQELQDICARMREEEFKSGQKVGQNDNNSNGGQ